MLFLSWRNNCTHLRFFFQRSVTDPLCSPSSSSHDHVWIHYICKANMFCILRGPKKSSNLHNQQSLIQKQILQSVFCFTSFTLDKIPHRNSSWHCIIIWNQLKKFMMGSNENQLDIDIPNGFKWEKKKKIIPNCLSSFKSTIQIHINISEFIDQLCMSSNSPFNN